MQSKRFIRTLVGALVIGVSSVGWLVFLALLAMTKRRCWQTIMLGEMDLLAAVVGSIHNSSGSRYGLAK